MVKEFEAKEETIGSFFKHKILRIPEHQRPCVPLPCAAALPL